MSSIAENSIEMLKEVAQNDKLEAWKKRNFFKSQIDILESNQNEFVKWVKLFIENHKAWLIKAKYSDGVENCFDSDFEESLDKLEESYFKDVIEYSKKYMLHKGNIRNIPISILFLEGVRFGYKEPTKGDLEIEDFRYYNSEIEKVYEIHFPNDYQGNVEVRYDRMLYCNYDNEEVKVSHRFGGIIDNVVSEGINRIVSINPIPKDLNIKSISKITIGFNFDKAFWVPITIDRPYFIKHNLEGDPISEITTIPTSDIEFYKENPLNECQVLIKATPKKYIHHPNSKNEWRIGGMPNWVQEPEEINCPECREKMKFIIQLPSGDLKDKKGEGVYYGSDGGITYGFWCDKDQIMGYIWQDT